MFTTAWDEDFYQQAIAEARNDRDRAVMERNRASQIAIRTTLNDRLGSDEVARERWHNSMSAGIGETEADVRAQAEETGMFGPNLKPGDYEVIQLVDGQYIYLSNATKDAPPKRKGRSQ